MLLGFFKSQKVLGFALLGFVNFQKSTRLFLLGFCFLIKKYSVGVYSVIRLFAKSTRLRFTRLLHFFYESTRLSQSPWLRAKNVDRGEGGYLERTRWYPNLRSLPLIKSDNIFGLFFVRFSLSPFGP